MIKQWRTVLLVSLLFLVACSEPLSTREKSTLVGGGIGGAAGAIIGAAVGSPGVGAAIGTALGAGTGALVGDRLQKRDRQAEQQQQQIDQQEQELAQNRQLIEDLKRHNLEARETERGVVVNLPDVLFAFGKADLTGEARVKVRDIADILNTRVPGRKILIEGHTDSVGSDEVNLKLSEARAQTVAGALEAGGVKGSRVTTRGYGKRYPVAPNTNPDGSDDPQGRAKNRRVEVVIEN